MAGGGGGGGGGKGESVRILPFRNGDFSERKKIAARAANSLF